MVNLLRKYDLTKFLNSFYYIISVVLFSYVIWLLRFFLKGDVLVLTTFALMLVLSIVFSVVVIFFENTIYSIPIALSLLFTLGFTNIDLTTMGSAALGFLAAILIVFSIIIHMVRFKVKPKLNLLGLSFILIALSFLIPLIYRGVNENNGFVSLLGLIYLLIYLFYSNTIKKDNINYLFRTLFILSMLLSFQILAIFIVGFINYGEPNIYRALIHLIPRWEGNVGWGNANDLSIHLVLFSASSIYYMYKYPKKMFPWIHLTIISALIVFYFARGSMIALCLLWPVVITIAIRNKDKGMLKNLFITLIFIISCLGIFYELTYNIFEYFFTSLDGNLNGMLTGRITLYKEAIRIFKLYPVFGSGWGDLDTLVGATSNRIIVYHSTIFHVLATGGIAGMIILGYHWFKTAKLFTKRFDYAKLAILITFVICQLHGLVDNTQYMLAFTVSTIIIFSVLENRDLSLETKELSL